MHPFSWQRRRCMQSPPARPGQNHTAPSLGITVHVAACTPAHLHRKPFKACKIVPGTAGWVRKHRNGPVSACQNRNQSQRVASLEVVVLPVTPSKTRRVAPKRLIHDSHWRDCGCFKFVMTTHSHRTSVSCASHHQDQVTVNSWHMVHTGQ